MKIKKLKIIGLLSFVLFFCLFFAVAFLNPNVASAQELKLITTRSEFFNAISLANDGDTLLVGDIDFNLQATGDVNDGERILINKSITVKNGKTSGKAVFSGASFVLNGTKIAASHTSFTFENIVFDEGLDTSALTAEDWIVVSPSKYPAKAQYAIECRGNTKATFINCDFKNYMHDYGAAIRAFYADYSSNADILNEHGNNAICELNLYLNNCDFDSNAALRDGGAIYIDAYLNNVSLTASNCRFDKNKSGVNEHELGGGAIYLQDAISEFVDCTFTNNQANYLYGSECLIDDTQSGGAIYCGGEIGEITVRNGTFAKNNASCGGAIAICNTAKAFLEECIITENNAVPVSDNLDGNKGVLSNKGLGGAIYTDGRVSVSINNSEICCNYAENALGAICNRYIEGISNNASITLYFCTIADNRCRLARADYFYNTPTWIWHCYPGDVFNIPTVELFGCFIVDDMYDEDIPRHELPSEENYYNYFGSMANAQQDGYILELPSGHEYGHVLPRNTTVVSTDLVKEKLGDKNYYGTFTVGANRNDVTYKFFADDELIDEVTLESGGVPTIPSFEKTGYTLTTWLLAEKFDYQADRTFVVGNATKSVDLHAVFTPNTYTVTYHFGEAKEEIEQTYGTELTPPTPQERNGYTFVGWFTAENGKGDKVVSGTLYQTASDTTYFAYYEKDFPIFYVIIAIVGGVLVIGMTILAGFVIYRRKHPHVIPATVDGAPMQEPKDLPDTSMLTPREKEVLELLLQGKQRNEIATILYISENTVKKNISSIYTKLNVSSRNELFALFK